MKITKVYTKSGDKGMTGLVGGLKVKKTNPRIEAYGTVDELSAQLGLLASFMKDGPDKDIIYRTQRNLFTVCSYLATDKTQTQLAPSYTLDPTEVEFLENEIDAINDNIQETKDYFGQNPRKIFADYYLDDRNISSVHKLERELWRERIQL